MVEKRTKTPQKQTKQNQPQPTGRDSTIKQCFLVKQVRQKLLTIYGPEFTKEEHGCEGLCQAKSQRSRQMDFTSLLPVTSGHCTGWQEKHGHDASSNWLYIQVKRHSSWWCSGSGGHSKQRKPASKVRKVHSPKGRVLRPSSSFTHCLGVRGIPHESSSKASNLVFLWEVASPKVFFEIVAHQKMRCFLPVRFGRSSPRKAV